MKTKDPRNDMFRTPSKKTKKKKPISQKPSPIGPLTRARKKALEEARRQEALEVPLEEMRKEAQEKAQIPAATARRPSFEVLENAHTNTPTRSAHDESTARTATPSATTRTRSPVSTTHRLTPKVSPTVLSPDFSRSSNTDLFNQAFVQVGQTPRAFDRDPEEPDHEGHGEGHAAFNGQSEQDDSILCGGQGGDHMLRLVEASELESKDILPIDKLPEDADEQDEAEPPARASQSQRKKEELPPMQPQLSKEELPKEELELKEGENPEEQDPHHTLEGHEDHSALVDEKLETSTDARSLVSPFKQGNSVMRGVEQAAREMPKYDAQDVQGPIQEDETEEQQLTRQTLEISTSRTSSCTRRTPSTRRSSSDMPSSPTSLPSESSSWSPPSYTVFSQRPQLPAGIKEVILFSLARSSIALATRTPLVPVAEIVRYPLEETSVRFRPLCFKAGHTAELVDYAESQTIDWTSFFVEEKEWISLTGSAREERLYYRVAFYDWRDYGLFKEAWERKEQLPLPPWVYATKPMYLEDLSRDGSQLELEVFTANGHPAGGCTIHTKIIWSRGGKDLTVNDLEIEWAKMVDKFHKGEGHAAFNGQSEQDDSILCGGQGGDHMLRLVEASELESKDEGLLSSVDDKGSDPRSKTQPELPETDLRPQKEEKLNEEPPERQLREEIEVILHGFIDVDGIYTDSDRLKVLVRIVPMTSFDSQVNGKCADFGDARVTRGRCNWPSKEPRRLRGLKHNETLAIHLIRCSSYGHTEPYAKGLISVLPGNSQPLVVRLQRIGGPRVNRVHPSVKLSIQVVQSHDDSDWRVLSEDELAKRAEEKAMFDQLANAAFARELTRIEAEFARYRISWSNDVTSEQSWAYEYLLSASIKMFLGASYGGEEEMMVVNPFSSKDDFFVTRSLKNANFHNAVTASVGGQCVRIVRFDTVVVFDRGSLPKVSCWCFDQSEVELDLSEFFPRFLKWALCDVCSTRCGMARLAEFTIRFPKAARSADPPDDGFQEERGPVGMNAQDANGREFRQNVRRHGGPDAGRHTAALHSGRGRRGGHAEYASHTGVRRPGNGQHGGPEDATPRRTTPGRRGNPNGTRRDRQQATG